MKFNRNQQVWVNVSEETAKQLNVGAGFRIALFQEYLDDNMCIVALKAADKYHNITVGLEDVLRLGLFKP